MIASRLLSILIVLQVRGRVSADALARELEVSVRTIYRDIDQLGAAGIPVYAERGRNGGFALLDGYRTNLTGLTPHEADAVALIGMAQAAMDLGFGADAAAARLKVLASVPARAGGLAQRIASRVFIDPMPWYSRAAPPATLRELAQSVWSERKIRITYQSWKKTARRTLAPLGLVMKAGTWYLAGGDGDAVRIYRVAAIRELVVLDEAARRPRDFDLAKFWADAARNFESSLRSDSARVRLSPTGVDLLHDWNPAATEALAAQPPTPAADGWVEARIPVERVPHAVREILRLGAEIEVLEPATLRQAVAAEAEKLARLHADRTRRRKLRR